MRDGHFRGWEEELENNTEKEGTCNRERGRRIMEAKGGGNPDKWAGLQSGQGERRLKKDLIWQLGTTGILPWGRFSGVWWG